MKPRSTKSPLVQLVLDVIQQSQLPLHQFLQQIGIQNVTKAMRHLDVALLTGQVNPHLLLLIQTSAYKIPEDQLQQVIHQNNQFIDLLRHQEQLLQQQVEKDQFRPRIEVIPELVKPTSISMFAVTGGNKRFITYLPKDISNWSSEDQLDFLKKSILENYSKHQGRTFFTGEITGYYFYSIFEKPPVEFNVQGDVVGVVNKPVTKTTCFAVIGNKLGKKFEFI